MYRRLCAAMLCVWFLFGMTACRNTGRSAEDTSPPADSSAPQDTVPSGSEHSGVPDAPEPDEGTAGIERTEQNPDVYEQQPEVSAPAQIEEPPASDEEQSPAQPLQSHQPEPSIHETQPEEQGHNVLIAYVTWAENTVVEDPSAVDVDATTSASVLAPGHVAQMAGWIQSEAGGDLFSIVTVEPYSSDYDACLDRAADEKAANARPALTNTVSNMADYDVIFLGYPDWWGTCPMAIFTFLDGYDFTGKTVIPFCAHGTSGLASSVRDIRAALPNITVLDAVGVQRPGMDTSLETARSTVTNWLAGLDY